MAGDIRTGRIEQVEARLLVVSTVAGIAAEAREVLGI